MKDKTKKILTWLGVILGLALVAIQFVPVARANPPVDSAAPMPADVEAIARRACFDCHSNETVWPWYAYVAPVSWLVAHDVEEGRSELNFSTWDSYPADRLDHKMEELEEEVREGEMPLEIYVPLHPEARLSEAERDVLIQWARSVRAELNVASGGHGEESEGDEH